MSGFGFSYTETHHTTETRPYTCWGVEDSSLVTIRLCYL